MTYTNIGKEDWMDVFVSPETYYMLKAFCKEHGFNTWSEAIGALVQEYNNPDRPQ